MASELKNQSGQPPQSAIAAGLSDGYYRAVHVVRSSAGFEIAKQVCQEDSGGSLADFAAGLTQPQQTSVRVALFEDRGVVYHRIDVPAKAADIEAIVKVQSEILLPLPPDQIAIGWRKSPYEQNGRTSVTIAAVRQENVLRFIQSVSSWQPHQMILENEGLVRGWRHFCGGTDDPAMVMRIRRRHTDLCLAEHGELVRAARMDTGLNDLVVDGQLSWSAVEMLVNDVAAAVSMFACEGKYPLCLISDGSPALAAVADRMKETGIDVRLDEPDSGVPFDCLSEAGAAILVIEGAATISLFKRFIGDNEAAGQRRRLSFRVAALIAAVTLVAAALGTYGMDKISLERSQKLLAEQHETVNIKDMLHRYQLVNTVAAERVDILEIMRVLSDTESHGVLLHVIHFRKGRPVSITGEAPSNDALYRFEDALRKQKGVANVKEQSISIDEREKKVTFTVMFDYRHYTTSRDALGVLGR